MKLKNEIFANKKLALGKDIYEVDSKGIVLVEKSKKAFIDILLKEGWENLGDESESKSQPEKEEIITAEEQPSEQQEETKQEESKPSSKNNKRRKPAFARKGDK